MIKDHEIDHVDCNKNNNFINNLEQVTKSENIIRSHVNDLCDDKINYETKKLIKKIIASTEFKKGHITHRYIADKFNINISNISKIKNKKLWKYVKINQNDKLINNRYREFMNNLTNDAKKISVNRSDVKHPNSKLNCDMISKIILILKSDIYKSGKIIQKEIGKMFNISRTIISSIKNSNHWYNKEKL